MNTGALRWSTTTTVTVSGFNVAAYYCILDSQYLEKEGLIETVAAAAAAAAFIAHHFLCWIQVKEKTLITERSEALSLRTRSRLWVFCKR